MDVPQTVTAALEDRPVAGATCLEAGAGVGNTTAGLLAADAARVYAVTNDEAHATTVRERIGHEQIGCEERERIGRDEFDRKELGRTAVLEADLRNLPLADDSIDLVTAHGLFNVVAPDSLAAIASELTRVAKPGGHLVIDDYAPLPDEASVRELFAVENAITELAEGRPALTFYPAVVLRRLFDGFGWEFDRKRVLLNPVPWTGSHLDAHTEVVRSAATALSNELGASLLAEAERLAREMGEESVGEMYSVAMRLPE